MLCPSCAAEIQNGNTYCGKCGANANEIHDLKGRLSTVEAQVRTVERLDQQRLEIDTAANAMERVRKWMTLLFFFVGLPVVATGIFVAVVWGKGAWDIHTIAANATQEIQTLGEKTKKDAGDAKQQIHEASENAKKEATETQTTVTTALGTTRQVEKDIKETNVQVGQLRTDVKARSDEVKALGTQVAGVKGELESTKQAATQIRQQVEEVKQEKAVLEVTEENPISFGETMATSALAGRIDKRVKKPGEVWVVVSLFENQHQPFTSAQYAAARTAVHAQYKAWNVYVTLISGSPRGGGSGLGAIFGAGSCNMNGEGGTGLKEPPCILYFNKDARNDALKIRDLIKSAQNIPDDRVKYLQPSTLPGKYPQLVDVSGIDVVVVMGKQPD